MQSNDWQLTLTLRRRPSNQGMGLIGQPAVDALLAKLSTVAEAEGFTLSGTAKAVRMNCPHCGRIIRTLGAKRCPMCGVNFETGRVK